MKKKLLVSFSGGRTSAFMTQWLLKNMADRFEMVVVFANTGKEREETLRFIEQCSHYFKFHTIWVEAVINKIRGVGTGHKVVSFNTASRNGEPFEAVIDKFGIPNSAAPFCTRELKERAIASYLKALGWKSYYKAIGIRIDEIDRMNPNRKKMKIIYPLVSMVPTTKQDINRFWSEQTFDLELKGYEGNCDACWKKSLRKLMTIAKENPHLFEWWESMEKKDLEHRFYRGNLTARDILEKSKAPFTLASDDSKGRGVSQLFSNEEMYSHLIDDLDENNGCEESCEVFAA